MFSAIGLHQHQAVILPLVRAHYTTDSCAYRWICSALQRFSVLPAAGIRQFGRFSLGELEGLVTSTLASISCALAPALRARPYSL